MREQIAVDRTEAPRDRKCLILANPRAGGLRQAGASSSSGAALEGLRRHAASLVPQAQVEEAPQPEQLKARVSAARVEGFTAVAAAGGDGTVRPIAQAVVGSGLEFGLLPVGTDNNFARSLGIPMELDEALTTLRECAAAPVDVGRTGGEVFTEAAGVGLFASLVTLLGPSGPPPERRAQIAAAILKIAWNPPAYRLTLVVDGVTLAEDASMISVCISKYLGKHWPIAPDAVLDDGLFDIIVVGALNRFQLAGFAAAVVRGADLSFPGVTRMRGSHVRISRTRAGARPLPVHTDDHIASQTPAEFELVRNALHVIGLEKCSHKAGASGDKPETRSPVLAVRSQ